MISDIEQQLATLASTLPPDVSNILSKWFTANNNFREDPRNTIAADFSRKEVVNYAKKNPGVMEGIRRLCDALEEEIHPTQDLLNQPIVFDKKKKKEKNEKKIKKTKQIDAGVESIRQPTSMPPLVRAGTSCLNDEQHIDKAFDAIKKDKKNEEDDERLKTLLNKLRLIINQLVEKEFIIKEHGLKLELITIQKNIGNSSSNFPHADYASDIKALEKQLQDAEKTAQEFILKIKNNVEICAKLDCVSAIKAEVDKLYLKYIANDDVVGSYKGLCYRLQFEKLNKEILVIQENELSSINQKYIEFEKYKEIKKVAEFFDNHDVDSSDNLNSKFIEGYGYLKRLTHLHELTISLSEENEVAKKTIQNVDGFFNAVFPNQDTINLLEAFCKAQPGNRSVITECIEPFKKRLSEYQQDDHPYSALKCAEFFTKAKSSIEVYQNILQKQQFQQFQASHLAKKFNAEVPSIFTRIKEGCKSFYQNHPYISWALMGAGIGLGVFLVGSVAVGVTIATGGAAGAFLAGALTGLLVLKVTGGAAVSVGAGAAVAVSVKKCSTAYIYKDLHLDVEAGYAYRDSRISPAPEPIKTPVVSIKKDRETEALRLTNPRFI